MTQHQVLLVKDSWKIFQSINPLLVGDVFYSRLFMTAPALKQMFTISKDKQSAKLVEMLNVIIGRLDKLEELTKDIADLARRHIAYGVKPEHYVLTGSALLWTLEQGLGKDWSPAVAEAWTDCYRLLATTMIGATEQPV